MRFGYLLNRVTYRFRIGCVELSMPNGNRSVERVAILGASPRADRYSRKALELLREYGHYPLPINPAYDDVLGEKCYPKILAVPGPIDTITIYLREALSTPLISEIIN